MTAVAHHLVQPPPQTELRSLLSALAQESGELAGVADSLQHLFGTLLAGAERPLPDALERAQALDGLVQRLEGLQTFLAGLSTADLEDVGGSVAAVAGALRLTSQARRFHAEMADASMGGVDAGDCDLF